MSRIEGEVELKRNDNLPNSSATTPGSIVDEEKFLVPTYFVQVDKKYKADWKTHIPIAILSTSFIEILFFFLSDEKLQRSLRFEPNKLQELWRLLTYMLLHEDFFHLILNVILQIFFAYFLELHHGKHRVLVIYFGGGITGALGASCFHPDLLIGASAGAYALLISQIADIFRNFESINYKLYRTICILIIVISDTVVYNLIQIFSKDELLISWGAHVFGGIAGFCLGLVLFKREEHLSKTRKLILFWCGCLLYSILMISLIVVSVQIKKCTPPGIIQTRYIYFC